MKRDILLLGLMLLISIHAFAEKTYMRDRTECKDVTVNLIGRELIVESPDDDYGESLQITHQGKKIAVELSESLSGRYRFLRAHNETCNKALAMPINKDEIAIFLGRDNRPFADTLMVLYYNTRTRSSELMPSKITTSEGVIEKGKAYFKLASEGHDRHGMASINNMSYHYSEKTFSPWIAFDGRNFRLDRRMTFEKFEHKELIDQDDLDGLSEFRELRYRLATNMGLKSTCLSINSANWNCSKQ